MPSQDLRSLIVMRHAKAEPFASDDEHRRLTPVGASAARDAGAWLASQDLVPDHAWVSGAARTRETWEGVSEAIGSQLSPVVDPSIYGAGPETLLDLLASTPSDARTVIVIGHNPTVAFMSHLLDDGSPDPVAWQRVSSGFPTASMAVFDVPVPWSLIGVGTAHLRAFHTGGHGD